VHHLSHSSWFYHQNNSLWGVQSMKLLSVELAPVSCCLIHLKLKYLPQNSIFKHLMHVLKWDGFFFWGGGVIVSEDDNVQFSWQWLKIGVFWDVSACRLLEMHQLFRVVLCIFHNKFVEGHWFHLYASVSV
jgi:hypothetical protein